MNHEIKIEKAQKIFPFMEELNAQDYTDIYDENFIEISEDEDYLNSNEQGFMLGYLEA